MSARNPTDVARSLALFQPRGGDTGPHADGWGVAWYEGRAAAIFKESSPAAASHCFNAVAEKRVESTQVIAHIRRANPPELGRAWANTHPFEREVGGRAWVFAHNGRLDGIAGDPRFALRRFHPLGDTDSEHAFCALLDRLTDGDADDSDDPVARLGETIAALATLGEFNFLLGNGRELLAHAHTRLSVLHRRCDERGCDQQVTLVATQPLTNEAWRALAPGTLHVFRDGVERRAG